VATVERLLQFAWTSDRGDLNVLKTHISHLRRKLSAHADGERIAIENVPGIGYRVVASQRENEPEAALAR
jgi:DNA-binding winged helix-turn-helix (wHTH) protein